jgi:hypothetical protein
MNLSILVSAGELIDKISILEIKSSKIKDPAKLVNVNEELKALRLTAKQKLSGYKNFEQRLKDLKSVNLLLWGIEDDIRVKEQKKEFDNVFIRLARDVYHTNDKRFEIKNLINQELGSHIKEEKDYKKYS